MTETAPSTAKRQARRPGVPLSVFLPLLALAAIAAAVTAVLATSSSSQRVLPGNVRSSSVTGYDGQLLSPQKPAPSFGALHNYNGGGVDLASLRGKAVFVTFIYTHCPDICPLITSHLHQTLERLGPDRSRQLQVVAVSVDPRGDNRTTVANFLHVHQMTGRMKYLIGDPRQLGAVWKAWNIGSTRDANNPDRVEHTALVYGISASGKLTTVYPENFTPGQIIHDLPKLLEE